MRTVRLSVRDLTFLFVAALLASQAVCAHADTDSEVKGLKTFSFAGKEIHPFTGGKEGEVYKHVGTGCLTHMWFGGDFPGYEHTRIRVYVDGEDNASIDMELGLGHGVGFGDPDAPWGIKYMGKTGQPSGIYNTFHIPFGKSVRVTAQLGEGSTGDPVFWCIIRGTENLPVYLGGVKLPARARLKLYKRENYRAQPLEEFDLFETKKAGALFMVTLAAKSEGNLNFMEAQMRGYFDGSSEPTVLSSGLEDYFLGTYYFNRGLFHNPVSGLTHKNEQDNSISAYRFHDDDPIFFQKGFRMTCRCGEKVGDKEFGDPRPTTYTTYAWVYEY